MADKKHGDGRIKPLLEIFVIILFFILFSYLIQQNLNFVRIFISDGLTGMFVYVLIIIAAIVIAPVSAMPILPIASNVWGWPLGAVLSIVGWTGGALIAFLIARRYGALIVGKLTSLKRIEKIESAIPQENIFWSIVFLRMVVPVDVLSYALGIFSKIDVKRYFLATLIGVSPFAFVFAYLGRMPVYYQITALAVAVLIFLAGCLAAIRNKNRREKSK